MRRLTYALLSAVALIAFSGVAFAQVPLPPLPGGGSFSDLSTAGNVVANMIQRGDVIGLIAVGAFALGALVWFLGTKIEQLEGPRAHFLITTISGTAILSGTALFTGTFHYAGLRSVIGLVVGCLGGGLAAAGGWAALGHLFGPKPAATLADTVSKAPGASVLLPLFFYIGVGAAAGIGLGAAGAALPGCGNPTATAVGEDIAACALDQLPSTVTSVIPDVISAIQGTDPQWAAEIAVLEQKGINFALCAVEAAWQKIAPLFQKARANPNDPALVALELARKRHDDYMAQHKLQVNAMHLGAAK